MRTLLGMRTRDKVVLPATTRVGITLKKDQITHLMRAVNLASQPGILLDLVVIERNTTESPATTHSDWPRVSRPIKCQLYSRCQIAILGQSVFCCYYEVFC